MPSSLQKRGDTEGIDFVRCRICGARRRVIATKHLSTHYTDRETYIEEYDLSPDDLIAKDFRGLQSSRRDFRHYSERGWLAAMKSGILPNGLGQPIGSQLCIVKGCNLETSVGKRSGYQ